jgi:hypothetical protein
MLFGMIPFFSAAQTTEERIETGRFGVEEPAAEAEAVSDSTSYENHWLFLGARLGPSLRIYTPPGDTAFTDGDNYGLSLDAGFQAGVQIVPLFSIQAEIVFSWDNASVWFYALNSNGFDLDRHSREFEVFSLQIPLTAKLNFYPGKFRVSPFFGAYVFFPLGMMTIKDPLTGEESVPYSFSPPLGIVGGVSAAFPVGPGMFFVDLRYSADLGLSEADGMGDVYRRGSVALCAGYEWAFLRKR